MEKVETSSKVMPILRQIRRLSFWAEWASVVGLVGLIALFSVLSPDFLTVGNIQALMQASAILVILVVGQSFVILTAGIDLGISSVMTFAAIVFGLSFAVMPFPLAVTSGVLAGLMAGAVSGLLVAKANITDFIVTLGMLSAAQGAALVFSDGQPITVINGWLLSLTTDGFPGVPYSFLIAMLIAVIAHVALFHTRFGTYVLATGGSKESANAVGIRTWRIKFSVYAISGLMAGIAAIILVGRLGAAEPAANLNLLLNSVAAVVLGGVLLFGGKGNIIGPICGALLLTVLTNGLTLLGVSHFYQQLAIGVIVVAAAYLTRFQK